MSADDDKKWGQWLGLNDGPAAVVYDQWETWLGDQLGRITTNEQLGGVFTRAVERSGGARAAFQKIAEQAVQSALQSGRTAEPDGMKIRALERRVTELERLVRELRDEQKT